MGEQSYRKRGKRVNKVIIMGRLTRDPETRYSQGKEPIAISNFTVAVDRKIKRENEPTADFFEVKALGKLGTFTEKYLKKGIKVVISGRVENDNYTNKNGEKVYTVKIITEEIEFAESKKVNDQAAGPAPSNYGWQEIPEGIEESLPFK